MVKAGVRAVLRLEIHSSELTLRQERFSLGLLLVASRAGQTSGFGKK